MTLIPIAEATILNVVHHNGHVYVCSPNPSKRNSLIGKVSINIDDRLTRNDIVLQSFVCGTRETHPWRPFINSMMTILCIFSFIGLIIYAQYVAEDANIKYPEFERKIYRIKVCVQSIFATGLILYGGLWIYRTLRQCTF
uniref:Uncharacterized protein n=1 Tax=Rhabditophanes sp. KR3021 TaxID=114890 RepID=A0AC35TM85_9BILA